MAGTKYLTNKKIAIIAVVVIILLGIAFGVYFGVRGSKHSTFVTSTTTSTTQPNFGPRVVIYYGYESQLDYIENDMCSTAYNFSLKNMRKTSIPQNAIHEPGQILLHNRLNDPKGEGSYSDNAWLVNDADNNYYIAPRATSKSSEYLPNFKGRVVALLRYPQSGGDEVGYVMYLPFNKLQFFRKYIKDNRFLETNYYIVKRKHGTPESFAQKGIKYDGPYVEFWGISNIDLINDNYCINTDIVSSYNYDGPNNGPIEIIQNL